MNMAFTVGCLFILQCIFLMDISEADPLIDISPNEITLGITSTLDVNCTFSLKNHPDLPAVISLVLSRANATGQDFEELAAITEFSPNSVKLLTQETVSATGVHNQTGESFLHLTWQYPTALQGGIYKCSAHGVDDIGHNVEMANISSVTVDQANLNDIFEKLRQMEMHESSMANTISTMAEHIQNLETSNSDLERTVTALQKAARLYPQGGYHNHYYYVSTEAYSDQKRATDACKAMGGELAVINDQEEHSAIQEFLKTTSGFSLVIISGTDEQSEGNWVLSGSNTSLPYTQWSHGQPTTNREYNCLELYSGSSWLMFEVWCIADPIRDNYRFMCEITI